MKNPVGRIRPLNRLLTRHWNLLMRIGRFADERCVPVYLVGGVVRDLLLKRENWDLDLTVEGDGLEFARLVAARYGAGLVLFERFATARLVLSNGTKMDIASTRRESYAQPAALPDVEPAALEEDLYRRDFTINAMAIQLNAAQCGQLHDPYGGLRDLREKRLRVLHGGSFCDDPTRIFRAVRFAQRFGFHLEPDTLRLLKEAAASDLIAQLSGPRLSNEILLLFSEPRPRQSIEWLARLNLLRFLHPRLRYAGSSKRLVQSLPEILVWWTRRWARHPIDRPLIYLMALLGGAEPSIVEAVVIRLMLSNDQGRIVRASGKRLETMAGRLGGTVRLRPSVIYHLLNGLPNEAVALCLAAVGTQTTSLGRMKRRVLDFVTTLRETKTALRGDDLLEMGVGPGPQVGTMLTQLLDARLDGLVRNKTDERAFVRARLAM